MTILADFFSLIPSDDCRILALEFLSVFNFSDNIFQGMTKILQRNVPIVRKRDPHQR